jgi:DNA-binding NarL/FixJ family response regulator
MTTSRTELDSLAEVPHGTLDEVGRALAARPYMHRGARVSETPIRVMLVDDHTIVRAGVKALLRSFPDISVVGEASGGDEALILARHLDVDVIVMDVDMPGGDGLSTTRELKQRSPDVRVLILTMHDERERLLESLGSGARGFLCKCAAERELADAIRVVASGEIYVRPAIVRMLSTTPVSAASADARDGLARLSPRERSVLERTAAGYSGPEIGEALGITAKTVDTYKQRIASKLGFTHRSDYVRFAHEAGLVPLAMTPGGKEVP